MVWKERMFSICRQGQFRLITPKLPVLHDGGNKRVSAEGSWLPEDARLGPRKRRRLCDAQEAFGKRTRESRSPSPQRNVLSTRVSKTRARHNCPDENLGRPCWPCLSGLSWECPGRPHVTRVLTPRRVRPRGGEAGPEGGVARVPGRGVQGRFQHLAAVRHAHASGRQHSGSSSGIKRTCGHFHLS